MEDDPLSTEETSSDTPLEPSDKQDSHTVSQELAVSSDIASCEPSDSNRLDDGENKDETSKVEINDNPSSSISECKVQAEAQELNSNAVSSTQPISGRQYQLAFDVDDTGSEASLTGSPRSLDMSNPVMSYLSQHHYLPSPVASQSHDLESLSHDMMSKSHNHKEEADESTDGGDTKRKASITSTGDDVSSVYSSSTLRPGGVSEQSAATKPPAPPTAEKEREESVKTPDSEVKLEDITLTTESPDVMRCETPSPQPKVHALSILTSDSEAGESPPYSPVPYLSGESRTYYIIIFARDESCMYNVHV